MLLLVAACGGRGDAAVGDSDDAGPGVPGSSALGAAPSPVAIVDGFALTISKPDPGDVLIEWADQSVGTYEVWASADPYFSPGDAGSSMVASGSGLSYETADGTEAYYRVVADGATVELSTTVGQLTYDLYPDYTKLGLCLVSEVDEWDELQADMPSSPYTVLMWDAAEQTWVYNELLDEVTFGPGEVLSVFHGDPVTPDEYTAVGHVPTETDVSITLQPGDNLVTTIPLRFGPIYASELLELVENGTGIAMWDAANQVTTWYPDDSDFLLPTCSPIHVEVSATSPWPPPPEESEIPPDPSEVAPPIDMTVTTSMYDAVSFLFEGDPPIQEGVDPGTIEPARVAVLRGYVSERDADPLPGVLVTVLGHPEYGSTRTREDGRYDIAVNGGGPVVLSLQAEDMLPAQRTAHARWQDYTEVDDVALVPLDAEVSVIDFVDPIEVHVASTSIDTDGTRTAALMFREGTVATMVMPDTSEDELTSISVRATEYTVGEEGPAAMPGNLPVASMYTYAVAYTIDEAEAAGAERVTFDPPAISYTENFVGFPVGEIVPAGSYDPTRGAWIPELNGLVIEVVGETSGLADLDLDGDGNADPGDYAAAGIDDDEREAVADLYDTGDELWRVELEHFSAWDLNWGWAPPSDAIPPPFDGPDDNRPDPNSCEVPGSILECQGQVMGERVGVAGTPFTLNYRSDRVPGRIDAYTLRLRSGTPLLDMPLSLRRAYLRAHVAGRVLETEIDNPFDQEFVITWDGFDVYGRRPQGSSPVDLCVGYSYSPVVYLGADDEGGSAFGYNGNGSLITGERGGSEATLWRCYTRGTIGGGMVPASTTSAQRALGYSGGYTLGVWDARAGSPALGGWTIDVHHSLAPQAGELFLGDGRRRTSVETYNSVIQTVAGGGSTSTTTPSSPVPALEANLGGNLSAVAMGADGSLYFGRADRVFRVDVEGVLHLFAGDGGSTVQGDGGAATSATIGVVWGLAVGPDDSVYISAPLNGRIRRVGPDGNISTVAGDGATSPLWGGDGGPATAASMTGVRDLAVAPDGTIFVAQDRGSSGARIRRITPDGILTTFAGGSCTSGAIHDKRATEDCIFNVQGLARDLEGAIYFSGRDTSGGSTPTQVFRIDPSGRVAHIAGGGTPLDDIGDGLLATDARLYQAQHIAVSAEGLVYIADLSAPTGNLLAGHRVRVIDQDGTIRTVGGRGFESGCTDFDSEGPATSACLHRPIGITVGHDNALYVTMRDEGRIRRISSAGLGWSADGRIVASEDHREIYVFSADGRHEGTVDALTGTTLWTFGYDGEGRLTTITDAYAAVTEITRDGNGEATGILSPDGLLTTLDVPEGGYLAEVTNPEGETDAFGYSAGGLLQSHVTPRLDTFEYEYDANGRLIEASDPEGGSKSLSRVDPHPRQYEVTMTTELGRESSWSVERGANGQEHRINTQPDGTSIDVVRASDGTTTATYPGGTVVTQTVAPDSRFGMQAPVRATTVLETPGGRERVEQSSRSVTLATEGDPLSMTALEETYTLNGRTWTWSWDGTTDEVVLESPEGRVITTTLDAMGKVDTMEAGTLAVLDVDYDARGRPETITHGSGGGARVAEMTYGTDGFIESILDPANRVHGFAHDQAGRLELRTRPDLEVVTYSYDDNGNLDGITPPGQPEHEFGHDATDRVTSYDPPVVTGVSAPSTTWTYTADHEVDVITRPDAEEISMVYGTTNGRLEEIIAPLGSYELTYDAAGRVDEFFDPFGGVLEYSYDGILRTSETLTGDVDWSVAWAYDDDLRVTTQTVNGTSAITFGYDDDSVLVAAGAETLVPAAATGLITDVLLVDSETEIVYDEFAAPVSFTTEVDSTVVYDLDLGPRDALGRVETLTETIASATRDVEYTYDDVGRLETVTEDTVLVATYVYDDNGNRTSVTTPGGTVNATYDDQDRLLTYGDLEFDYNDNGELYTRTDTVEVETTVYDYDVMGNLRSVELPDTTFIEYVTDARDRRVGRLVDNVMTHGWVYGDQLEPIAEVDGTGAIVSRFVYGYWPHVPDYMVRSGTTYRIVTDHLGSVRLVVNADTGAVAQRIDYDAWGDVLADTNPGFQPFGFAGGLYDPATRLVRFGARDYDASVGRWISKDPILFNGGDENLYGYCGQDPVNYVDPTGNHPLVIPAIPAGIEALLAAGLFAQGVLACIASGVCDDLWPDRRPRPWPGPEDWAENVCKAIPAPRAQPIPIDDAWPKPKYPRTPECEQAHVECMLECQDRGWPTFPTPRGDQGMPYFNCINKCMAQAGC